MANNSGLLNWWGDIAGPAVGKWWGRASTGQILQENIDRYSNIFIPSQEAVNRAVYHGDASGLLDWSPEKVEEAIAELLPGGGLLTIGNKAAKTLNQVAREKYIRDAYYTHEDLYHGGAISPDEGPLFDKIRMSGESTNSPVAKMAFGLTNDPEVANGYARNAVYNALKRGERKSPFVSQFRLDRNAKIGEIDWADMLKENPKLETLRSGGGQKALEAQLHQAKAEGKDVLIVKGGDDTVSGKSADTIYVLNPGLLKLKHGKYDSAKRGLNAPALSLGGTAVLGGLLGAGFTSRDETPGI